MESSCSSTTRSLRRRRPPWETWPGRPPDEGCCGARLSHLTVFKGDAARRKRSTSRFRIERAAGRGHGSTARVRQDQASSVGGGVRGGRPAAAARSTTLMHHRLRRDGIGSLESYGSSRAGTQPALHPPCVRHQSHANRGGATEGRRTVFTDRRKPIQIRTPATAGGGYIGDSAPAERDGIWVALAVGLASSSQRASHQRSQHEEHDSPKDGQSGWIRRSERKREKCRAAIAANLSNTERSRVLEVVLRNIGRTADLLSAWAPPCRPTRNASAKNATWSDEVPSRVMRT